MKTKKQQAHAGTVKTEPETGTGTTEQETGLGEESAPESEKDLEIGRLKKELLYQAAEIENFKRRTENRYRDMLRYASEPLLRDLLTVVDNLERATLHAVEAHPSLGEGLGHILAHFKTILANHEVEEIEALGVKFDPNLHEAMAQVPGEEDGKIIAVQESGYTYRGKLIRPPKVIVSRAP